MGDWVLDLSPQTLVRSIFFLNEKNFCLRWYKEHRGLKLSQFIRNKDPWRYIENGSKAFRGDVGNLHRENKVIRQYPCLDAGCACHIYLLDLYFSKLSEGACKEGAFYFTLLRNKEALGY